MKILLFSDQVPTTEGVGLATPALGPSTARP